MTLCMTLLTVTLDLNIVINEYKIVFNFQEKELERNR